MKNLQRTLPVLPDSFDQVVGYTDIESAVVPVSQNVNGRIPVHTTSLLLAVALAYLLDRHGTLCLAMTLSILSKVPQN